MDEKALDEQLESLSHEDLCEVTLGTLTRLLHSDQLLSDLPAGVTVEEVSAQIAVAQGQSITLQINRNNEEPLNVVVAQEGSTVLDLKKALKRTFELRQQRKRSRTKISWRYIWRTYWLSHNGYPLTKDDALLSTYNIRNKSQIEFVKHENVYKTNLAWQRNLWKMEHLQNVCENLNVQLNSLPPLNDLDHILVDHNHQLLYCYVPKLPYGDQTSILATFIKVLLKSYTFNKDINSEQKQLVPTPLSHLKKKHYLYETTYYLIQYLFNYLRIETSQTNLIFKVACTNWKRLFMIMSNRWNSTNIMTIPGYVAHASGSVTRLSELSEEEAIRCLRNYTRFIVVRHPFERLLSAYRNKLEGKHPSAQYFQKRVGRYIIKHYRANASSDSLKYGHDVTFYEFAQYLLVEGKDKHVHNEHWRPISKLCHPCSISYNIIGTYENLVEDSDLVLSLVNAANLSFPNTKTANTAHRIYDYFRQLSLETTKELYRFYELDFKLFGYDLVNILGYDVG